MIRNGEGSAHRTLNQEPAWGGSLLYSLLLSIKMK